MFKRRLFPVFFVLRVLTSTPQDVKLDVCVLYSEGPTGTKVGPKRSGYACLKSGALSTHSRFSHLAKSFLNLSTAAYTGADLAYSLLNKENNMRSIPTRKNNTTTSRRHVPVRSYLARLIQTVHRQSRFGVSIPSGLTHLPLACTDRLSYTLSPYLRDRLISHPCLKRQGFSSTRDIKPPNFAVLAVYRQFNFAVVHNNWQRQR